MSYPRVIILLLLGRNWLMEGAIRWCISGRFYLDKKGRIQQGSNSLSIITAVGVSCLYLIFLGPVFTSDIFISPWNYTVLDFIHWDVSSLPFMAGPQGSGTCDLVDINAALVPITFNSQDEPNWDY